MSKLAKQKSTEKKDSIDIFGKVVASELHDIPNASNDCAFRKGKRKIQPVLRDAWDTIDSTSSKSSRPSTQLLDNQIQASGMRLKVLNEFL
jgi:hypothetical protein